MDPSQIVGPNGHPISTEPAPAPSAGAAPQPTNAPAYTAPAPPAAPAVNDGNQAMYSPEDVSRIVQERLARDRAERKSKAAPPQPAAKPADEVAALRAELQQLTTLRTFDQAVSAIPLDSAKRNALQTLFTAENPENPTEWATAKATELGWLQTQTQTQSTQSTQPQPLPRGTVPVTHGAAPAADPTAFTDADDPLQWRGELLARIRREKGSEYVKRRFMERMANTRVVKGR